jgi:hypothetical protein
VSDEDKIEAEAEKEVEAEASDDRPIKEIIKEASKAAAKAQGRRLFFYIVKNMKAQGKEKGKSPKSVRIPQKAISALRPGDVTEYGQVAQVGKHVIEKGAYQVTFVGERGSDVRVMPGKEKVKVVSRREIKS